MGWWFGRILTFEIEGDEESPTLGSIFGDASASLIVCKTQQTIAGFAAHGPSIKSAIEPLIDGFGLELFDDGEVLRQSSVDQATVSFEELGNSADNDTVPGYQREQMTARAVPMSLRLTFYDAARDYQTGEARASAGGQGGSEAQSDLPAVLDAAAAKSLAQQMIARAWANRDTLTLRLPPSRLTLEPGCSVDLPMSPARWIVNKVTIDGFVLQAEMKPSIGATVTVGGDSGRIVPNSDVIAGPVSIALLDIPALSPNGPTLLLAASSPTPSWKRAPVDLDFVGQSVAVRTAARKSILGSAVTILPAADASSIDTANTVEVQLIDEDQWLVSCDDVALADGANVALIGGELVQFADVTPLGSGRFRLARFLRGRAGTELAVASHSIDEVFCLIETGSLQSIPLPITSIGKEVTAQISGGASASLIVRPRAEGIPSPSGGTTIDDEARTSIDQILATLRQHGFIAT